MEKDQFTILHSKFSIPAGWILRWFMVSLAIIAVLALVFVWVVRALPEMALAQISEMTNTKIAAESVNLGLDGSVLIRKLVIKPDQEQKYDDAILKAETVYARFGLCSLLLLGPRLKEIRINDFVLDAQYDLDTGRWNIAAMRIRVPRDGSGKMPVVHLSQGILQYSKVSGGQAKVAASVPVRAEFGFDHWTQEGYRFNIRTATLSSGFGKSNLSGFFRPGRITFTGGISSTDIPTLEWAWAIDVLAAELTYGQDRNYSVALRIKDFHSTRTATSDSIENSKFDPDQIGAKFLHALQGFFSRYSPVGTVDIELNASGNFDRLSESAASGKVYCKDVSVCDRYFPYTIEHLAGEIDFTQESVVLNALSGKHGDVNITINGLVNGFSPAQEYQLRVTSNNMLLDNDLYSALSADQKNLWDAFSPSGRIAVDQCFSKTPQADNKTTLTVELLDAQAIYKHFPYPLRHLTGKLFIERDSIFVSDIISQVGRCKISASGNVTGYNTPNCRGYFSIKGENVPLDSTLAAALPVGQRSLYDQFVTAGLADAQIKIFTPQKSTESGQKWRTSFLADVTLKEVCLKVGESPLEISDISAKAVITPNSISIKGFTGQCSDGQVSIAGTLWLANQAQPSSYHLTIDAKRTQLSAKLVDLLPGPAKKIFSGSPQGRINLAADLRKSADQKEPSYQIAVECLGNSITFKQFAYPLKNVAGKLAITDKTLTLDLIGAGESPSLLSSPEDIRADRQSRITLNGQIALTGESGNLAISAHNIAFDEQLGIALTNTSVVPPIISGLRPSGWFDLDSVSIKIFTAKNPDFIGIDFAGAVRLKDCRFDLSGTEAQLNALLNAKGLYRIPAGDGQGRGFSTGTLSLIADSLTVKGKTITNLNADISYDPDTQSWRTENLLADCYGGKVAGRMEIGYLGSGFGSQERRDPALWQAKYLLQVGFDGVDLRKFLADKGQISSAQTEHTSGTMTGSLSIAAGVGAAPIKIGGQVGQCRFIIRDMRVGKLSPLAKLLYVLNPDPFGAKDFAFEQMVVDSYIKADKLLFEEFDLSGQAIAFSGGGWMDLASDNVNLVLTARGKRLAAAEPSLVQSLAEGLGQAVIRMEITGNVHDPQVTTRTLPVIKDSLKILGTKRK